MPTPIVFTRGELLSHDDLNVVSAQAAAAAPLSSPALTGVPTAPTAATGTNTSQIATCAFTFAELQTVVQSLLGLTGPINATQFLAALAPLSPSFAGIKNTGAYVGNTVIFDGFTGAFRGAVNYTVAATDETIIVNKIPIPPAGTTGPTTIFIPAPGTIGRCLIVKDGKGDAGSNPITIVPASKLIDGNVQAQIDNPFGCFILRDTFSQWSILSTY